MSFGYNLEQHKILNLLSKYIKIQNYSKDIAIVRALQKVRIASSMLEKAHYLISSSFFDPSFHLDSNSSFSYLISIYNHLEEAGDDLNSPFRVITNITSDELSTEILEKKVDEAVRIHW
ncbi:hypothetical protein LOTGIDRAFT_153456 [Lottia gigantea]|uniref:Uncharacterized protein n=1 Tax=Lottia gigantea TaxID=225164 RepID=V3ZRD4_LOTGI|nr:hypothetical protein LOTGIDRAFT_153456 [Lottia gigantea]ESO93978.1 hypothetical protein LOTGIDRAFT_153456 [Lottia gigantea]